MEGKGCLSFLLHQQPKVPTTLAAQLLTNKESRRDVTEGVPCTHAKPDASRPTLKLKKVDSASCQGGYMHPT